MKKEFIDIMYKQAVKAVELGFFHLTTQDETFNGRNITIRDKECKFFSNCSYLGLETNESMKQAAIEAVQKFGTQFSSSRVTVSLGLYEEMENLLSQIFGKPVYLAPSTSLGHIAVIPTIMDENDAIIMDQQVHNSVKNAVQMVKPEGVHTEIIKHNRMDHLETRIQILKQNHNRVWYMCDSVYSMFGDSAPFSEIYQMLNQYEQFHLYVDDAHGMSWTGKNGRGFALSKMPYHDKMIMATSLAKGFGSCGGAIVCNNDYLKTIIKNFSSTSIFSGPLQPAVLGANIASAKIHLSDEIDTLQNDLFERMFYFTQTGAKYNLPVVNNELTPIFYVALGKTEVAFKISKFLQNEGFYCMTTFFPAVPMKNSGLRLTVNNHNTLEDINGILERVAYALPKALEEEGSSLEEIYQTFGIKEPNKEIITELPLRKIA